MESLIENLENTFRVLGLSHTLIRDDEFNTLLYISSRQCIEESTFLEVAEDDNEDNEDAETVISVIALKDDVAYEYVTYRELTVSTTHDILERAIRKTIDAMLCSPVDLETNLKKIVVDPKYCYPATDEMPGHFLFLEIKKRVEEIAGIVPFQV